MALLQASSSCLSFTSNLILKHSHSLEQTNLSHFCQHLYSSGHKSKLMTIDESWKVTGKLALPSGSATSL